MTDEFEKQLTIERFENGNISAEEFDHEAHLYVGWLYVTEFELSDAIARFERALKRLTAKLGVPDKYHATITWFFMLLIAERRDADPGSERGRAGGAVSIPSRQAPRPRHHPRLQGTRPPLPRPAIPDSKGLGFALIHSAFQGHREQARDARRSAFLHRTAGHLTPVKKSRRLFSRGRQNR